MRRRLDLAASLVGRPQMIFLDEPTTGLDPVKRTEVWRTIRSLSGDGVAVLLTTQYLEEADALADEIAVIDHGKIIARGTPTQLKHRVGRQTIEVRPGDPVQLAAAAAVIRAVTGHIPEQSGRGVLTVPTEGDATFTDVVRRLNEAQIAVTELSLRLPSLDDVFFTLTGHHTRDQAEEAA